MSDQPVTKSILSGIDHGIAKQRIQAFKDIKIPKLPASHPQEIKYLTADFLDMLGKVVNDPKMTGLRIYFAAAGNNLTLAFAPTVDQSSCDLTDCGDVYVSGTTPGAPIKLDPAEGKKRILEFGKKGGLYSALSKSITSGPETRSMWFCKENLLATYNDIKNNHASTKYITACFAAYRSFDSETVDFGRYHVPSQEKIYPHSQLTLIFKTDPFQADAIAAKAAADMQQAGDGEEFYDTGAPCPPDPACPGSPYPDPDPDPES